jgi:hypothetical protein
MAGGQALAGARVRLAHHRWSRDTLRRAMIPLSILDLAPITQGSDAG